MWTVEAREGVGGEVNGESHLGQARGGTERGGWGGGSPCGVGCVLVSFIHPSVVIAPKRKRVGGGEVQNKLLFTLSVVQHTRNNATAVQLETPPPRGILHVHEIMLSYT